MQGKPLLIAIAAIIALMATFHQEGSQTQLYDEWKKTHGY